VFLLHSRHLARPVAQVVACILAAANAGCVIPVNMTEPASPALIGVYHRSDGRPAVGARVAVMSHDGEAACARAVERTAVDSAGVFRLRSTTLRRRWLVLIPPIERFFNYFWLCAGASDSLLGMAYYGRVPLGYSGAAVDTVRCQEWAWQGRTQVTCAGPREENALQTGGRWTDGATAGFYRLIVINEHWDPLKPGVFVQWVQSSDTHPREVVRETVAFPLVPKLIEIEEARLEVGRDGLACVIIISRGNSRRWYRLEDVERVAMELGPPGEMRRVAACP